MRPNRLNPLVLLLLLWACPGWAGVVVIGHNSLPKLDDATVQKIYTGRALEVGGVVITAVNAGVGSALREHFLRTYLNQTEEKYTAYWTVRRYIGKGLPPKELPGVAEVIGFVQSIPGAVGYIDEADLKPGLNILFRK